MDLEALLREREWRKCQGPQDATHAELLEAFSYFCARYWYVKHPERGRILFDMREAQVETVDAWLQERYSIVLKARQIGFSTLAAAFSFWCVYFWGDRFIVMLSRTERESVKLLAKAKYGYKLLPQWMRERGPQETSSNQQKMTFSNDSAIESLPSGSDPARGESVWKVIVDEMAFLPNSEEAWASIEPITDVGGSVILLSTANGVGNQFHSMWVAAEQGLSGFKPLFFPWWAGGRDEAWYESKKRSMPAWQLHQEYPSNPDEAFIRSGNPVFDTDMLRNLPVEEPRRFQMVTLSPRNTDFRPSPEGELSVWAWPDPDHRYCIGADVSEGLEHGDYSSAHVIDATDGRVVAHWHGRVDADIFGQILAELGWRYAGCLVGVESNNHGLTTLKALQRYGYKNIYRQRRLAQRHGEPTEILGWRTTVQSKPLAVDELNGGLRDEALTLACERTIAELRTFVRDPNGRTHGSPHDDRVMSLAIANQMLKYVWLPEFVEDKPLKPYTFDWFVREMDRPGDGHQKVAIGSYNVR